jgi:hypothetical protein
MVQLSGAITTAAAVDYAAARQTKEESVPSDAFSIMTSDCITPPGGFSLVLEHAPTCSQRSRRKDAFAVNRRPPDSHAPHIVFPLILTPV